MRDIRFDWDAGRLYNKKQDDSATAILSGLPDRAALDAFLADWWFSLSEDARTGDGAGAEALRASLEELGKRASPGHQELVSALAAGLVERRQDEPGQRAGLMALGSSIGIRVAGESPNAAAFDSSARSLKYWWTAEDAFEDSFRLVTPPDARPAWVEQLRAFPKEIPELLGHYSHRGPAPLAQLREEEQKARSRGIAAYLWRRRDERCELKHRWSRRAQTVLAWSPAAFVAVLEDLPLSEFRDSLFRHGPMSEDREVCLGVLAAAPTVFDGEAWTGKVTAMLALESFLRLVDGLHQKYLMAIGGIGADSGIKAEAEKTLASFENDEVPTWCASVIDALRARPDGEALALLLSAKMARDKARPAFGGRRPTWSSRPAFWGAVRSGFGGVTADKMSRLASSAGSGPHGLPELPYLTATALLGDDSNGVWQWYLRLLREQADEIRSDARFGTGSWQQAMIASGLLGQNDQVAAWRETWRSLFQSDRERARFDTTDNEIPLLSQHLVGVGIGMLNRADVLARCAAGAARDLWRELCKGGKRLAHHRNSFRVHQGFEAVVFVVAKIIFGEGWPIVLDENREWLLTDPEVQVFVARELMRGGVDRAEVLSEMSQRDCDPIAAILMIRHRIDRSPALEAAVRDVEPSGH